jgi:DNA-binding response OmpR family regulator
MKPRLLVAEGDRSVAEDHCRYFSARGFRVEVVGDGLHCWETLQRYVPQVLILSGDLRWGGGDGVLAAMRQDERLAAMPVLLVLEDGVVDDGDAAEGCRRPVVGCFRKPVDTSDLFKVLMAKVPELATQGFLAEAERLLDPESDSYS